MNRPESRRARCSLELLRSHHGLIAARGPGKKGARHAGPFCASEAAFQQKHDGRLESFPQGRPNNPMSKQARNPSFLAEALFGVPRPLNALPLTRRGYVQGLAGPGDGVSSLLHLRFNVAEILRACKNVLYITPTVSQVDSLGGMVFGNGGFCGRESRESLWVSSSFIRLPSITPCHPRLPPARRIANLLLSTYDGVDAIPQEAGTVP